MAKMKRQKPDKPYPDFPLQAHACGQWTKKVRGQNYYFGVWEDHNAAVQDYHERIAGIRAGRDPKDDKSPGDYGGGVSIQDALISYMDQLSRTTKRATGAGTTRHVKQVRKSCQTAIDFFGKHRPLDSLKAIDFTKLAGTFPEEWAPMTFWAQVRRIRTAIGWCWDEHEIDKRLNFGKVFVRPRKPVVRRAKKDHEAEHGKQFFQASELRRIIRNSDGYLKACTLLGINAGFGSSDCGRLTMGRIDETGFFDFFREKTGIDRHFIAWPETIEAIAEATAFQIDEPREDGLCFQTQQRNPVWNALESGEINDPLGEAFRVKNRLLGIWKLRRGFYSLKRTFQTVADGARDDPAVKAIVGHDDPSVSATYRQGVPRERLQAVTDHVRDWLLND